MHIFASCQMSTVLQFPAILSCWLPFRLHENTKKCTRSPLTDVSPVPPPLSLPPFLSHVQPELYGTAGKGLYDPSPLSRSPLYFSIYAEGGLTMR